MMQNKRKHERVRVQFRSHFSMKGKMLAGDGDLTDLSPGGCRILSSVQVSAGSELELCIFPGDDANPILIDVATVRWCQPKEFGLAFTGIRAPAQRRLTDVWRKLAKPA
ncbi:PilZ domain-containing protein [Nitrospirales bacterium NOB]|nr:MAG: PilZ domain protein [Nitrospira sp. OLB3]MBV6470716.1 hypothetical protein [Nitrospirota bacterium]MCE7964868.1 PilZ domain-containing protein [Nitrospira sp. NTP2]MCK6492310.1 PilZ domain-containing protein [Nitrospira sp.]MDL1888726.1 PilZ domain-containing protein [Nitrospirales bacterium NOB]MEB2338033.1 PilZ domain-containing protein [Nitrospirales bacterium]